MTWNSLKIWISIGVPQESWHRLIFFNYWRAFWTCLQLLRQALFLLSSLVALELFYCSFLCAQLSDGVFKSSSELKCLSRTYSTRTMCNVLYIYDIMSFQDVLLYISVTYIIPRTFIIHNISWNYLSLLLRNAHIHLSFVIILLSYHDYLIKKTFLMLMGLLRNSSIYTF